MLKQLCIIMFCIQPDNLRLRIIGRLKSLNLLNGAPVTEAESSAALRVAAGSRISQVLVLLNFWPVYMYKWLLL